MTAKGTKKREGKDSEPNGAFFNHETPAYAKASSFAEAPADKSLAGTNGH